MSALVKTEFVNKSRRGGESEPVTKRKFEQKAEVKAVRET
jgi:hypothetical protein